MRKIVALVAVILAMSAEPAWAASEATGIEQKTLARKLMNMSEAQLRKLKEGKKTGLLELRPILLPTEFAAAVWLPNKLYLWSRPVQLPK